LAPILGSTILGAAVVLAAWPEEPATDNRRLATRRPVQVAEVSPGGQTRIVRLAGVTRAAQRAELSFAVPARLADRSVATGDVVTRGQTVARLDDREYRLAERAASASLAELDVRLAQARRDLDRVSQLAAARAATAEEVEQASAATAALEAARDAASARLAEANRLLEEASLRAPFDGTVTAVNLEPGEWVVPGRTVVELAGNAAVEIMVEAPETVLPHLEVEHHVDVNLPLAGFQVPGRITSVAAASAGPGRLFPVEVAVEDAHGRVVPGLTAEVELQIESEASLTVPLQAILNPGSSRPSVYVIADGLASRVPVELGQVTGGRIAVTGDLEPGDLVAVAGHMALADGDAVEVF
jgi:RND family efflux transporter MFP subunit